MQEGIDRMTEEFLEAKAKAASASSERQKQVILTLPRTINLTINPNPTPNRQQSESLKRMTSRVSRMKKVAKLEEENRKLKAQLKQERAKRQERVAPVLARLKEEEKARRYWENNSAELEDELKERTTKHLDSGNLIAVSITAVSITTGVTRGVRYFFYIKVQS